MHLAVALAPCIWRGQPPNTPPHSPFHKFTLSPPQSRPEPARAVGAARRAPEECRTPSCKLVDAFRLLLLVSLSLLPRTRPPPPPWEVPLGGGRLPDPTRLFLSPSPGDNNASIAADLCELTSGSHLAGTPASAPVASTSRCSRSYPGHGSLSLLRPDGFPLARGSRGRGATRRAIVPHVRACPAGPSRRWCSSTSAATARRTVCLVSLNCTFLKKKQILAAICEKVVVISRKLR